MCKALAVCRIVPPNGAGKTKALHLRVLCWCVCYQENPAEMYLGEGKGQGTVPRPAARLSFVLLPEIARGGAGSLGKAKGTRSPSAPVVFCCCALNSPSCKEECNATCRMNASCSPASSL